MPSWPDDRETVEGSTVATGFRPLRVVEKTRESATITSFLLEPRTPEAWRPFRAGQFLVLKIPASNERGYVLRNYSVSSDPAAAGRYRISVKREASPREGVPPGIGSNHLHDEIGVGAELLAEGPRGDFWLDPESQRPVVLLSGGVGLTPMLSMLHAVAARPGGRALFLHACDNGEVHAHADEVRRLARSNPDLRAHFVYRFPTAADTANRRHDAQGMVTKELLQALLPLDDYDFYLCGPPPFMQAVHRIVRELGVDRQRIRYEFFGPSTLLEDPPKPATSVAPAAPCAPPLPAGAVTVTFKKSGRTAEWTEGAASILSLAEASGLSPEFSCRAGICGSCSVGLLDGRVSYTDEPLDDPGEGRVLICCARPEGSVVIDL